MRITCILEYLKEQQTHISAMYFPQRVKPSIVTCITIADSCLFSCSLDVFMPTVMDLHLLFMTCFLGYGIDFWIKPSFTASGLVVIITTCINRVTSCCNNAFFGHTLPLFSLCHEDFVSFWYPALTLSCVHSVCLC